MLKRKLKKIGQKVILKLLSLLEKLFLTNRRVDYEWLGNEYGGFFVNTQALDEDSIIYSFGIGEDISFDKELITHTGCEVHGFDPTPKSIEWVKNNPTKGFFFHQYGISTKTGFDRLYLPKNDNYVSGSVLQTKNTSSQYVKIEMRSLEDIMVKLKHDKIDVLKMDVEGLEYEILKDILKKNIPVNQILVEFHDRFFSNGWKMRKEVIVLLKKSGYTLYAISKSHQEFSFMKEELFSTLRYNSK